MSNNNNISGVVLDRDFERFYAWDLPLLKVRRTRYYKGDEIESHVESYGEFMPLGDFHIGHDAHSENMFNAYLNFLKDHPHIMIGLMGDYIEYAINAPYIQNETSLPDEQIDHFVKAMKPFADRILFILWGNHEERYARSTKSNRLIPGLAREIGVSEDCFVAPPQRGVSFVLSAGEKEYGCYAHHSRTGAVINKTIQLRRSGSNIRAAVIMHGHTHHLGFEQRTIRELTHEGRVTRRQWLVSTGCFMKDAGYAEARSYPLNVVGAPLLRFYADRGKIEFDDISTEYKDYLVRGGIKFPGAEVGVKDENWGNIYGEGRGKGGRAALKDVVSPSKHSVSVKKNQGLVSPMSTPVKPKKRGKPFHP